MNLAKTTASVREALKKGAAPAQTTEGSPSDLGTTAATTAAQQHVDLQAASIEIGESPDYWNLKCYSNPSDSQVAEALNSLDRGSDHPDDNHYRRILAAASPKQIREAKSRADQYDSGDFRSDFYGI